MRFQATASARSPYCAKTKTRVMTRALPPFTTYNIATRARAARRPEPNHISGAWPWLRLPSHQRLPSHSCPSCSLRAHLSQAAALALSSPSICSGGGETMAELVAAVPSLLAADQADQHYADAVQTAVAACAEDTEGQTCFICMDGAAEEGLVRGCACRGAAGVAHVSCLARQAQVVAERDGGGPGFARWHTCGLCEQRYHGVVQCALGWACWRTYVGRLEADWPRRLAINVLGNGLSTAGHDADALSMREAELSMMRRLGAPEHHVLAAQGNLAINHEKLGRLDEALLLKRDVYSGTLKLLGTEHKDTLLETNNYASSLVRLQRFEEAKLLLQKTMPVARRVLGEEHRLTFKMRWFYARALYNLRSTPRDRGPFWRRSYIPIPRCPSS